MLLDRRSFLAVVLASPLLNRDTLCLAEQGIGPVGLELLTVRAELQKDFEGTLAKVAAIGYKEVELAGYLNHSPEDIRTALQNSGLNGISSAIPFSSLGERSPAVVDAAHMIGVRYLVVGSIDEASRAQPGIWQRAAEQFNRAGEVCKVAGIRLAYHNHLFEFARPAGATKRPYEILAESTEPSLVGLEMDLCWITAAGEEPQTYFTRYPRRFVSVHVKDLKRIPPRPPDGSVPDRDGLFPDVADVGRGVINWSAVLPQCWSAGVRHFFVEHDVPQEPMASAERSYRYLAGFRFDAAR